MNNLDFVVVFFINRGHLKMASNRRCNVEVAFEFVLGDSGSQYSESEVDFNDTIVYRGRRE